MLIDSKENSRFKKLLKLSSSSRARNQAGVALLEGMALVEDACTAGIPIDSLVISRSALGDPKMLRLFEETDCNEHLVMSDRLVESLSELPSGACLLASVLIPPPTSIPPSESCLLLERIQDPGNLGTILRTAAAAGIKHVATSRQCAGIWGPKVLRAGVGAHFRLNLLENQDLELIARQFEGMRVATAPRARQSLYQAKLREPTAWMFGSEGEGLSATLRNYADVELAVPMPGGIESLNVASSVAICLFEMVRQRSHSFAA